MLIAARAPTCALPRWARPKATEEAADPGRQQRGPEVGGGGDQQPRVIEPVRVGREPQRPNHEVRAAGERDHEDGENRDRPPRAKPAPLSLWERVGVRDTG